MCEPIEFNPTLSAIIGPRLGTGASPFVDDNKSADPAQQPAGYTFFGQFIDHDVTRTQTALSALNELNRRAQGDANVRAKLTAAGHHPGSAEASDRKRRSSDLGAEPQHRQARPRQRVRRHRLCGSDRRSPRRGSSRATAPIPAVSQSAMFRRPPRSARRSTASTTSAPRRAPQRFPILATAKTSSLCKSRTSSNSPTTTAWITRSAPCAPSQQQIGAAFDAAAKG